MNCYNFKKIFFEKGLMDNSIDATYIIHLEDNGRLESINEQLSKYQPSKVVYIVFNKGYKKCKKNLHKQEPPVDLVDAFLKVFKHSIEQNYNNILILEDDFIFNSKIKNKEITNDIDNFINEKKGESFMYMIGVLPYIQIPYKNNHYKLIGSNGTHASVYSKKLIEDTLNNNNTKINDWDYHTNTTYVRYVYKEPLCYQLFTDTENSKYWDNSIWNGSYFIRKYLKFLKLDIEFEPGYSTQYLISKIYILLQILIILFILYIFFYK
jgi:hypothetical protein